MQIQLHINFIWKSIGTKNPMELTLLLEQHGVMEDVHHANVPPGQIALGYAHKKNTCGMAGNYVMRKSKLR